MEVGDEATEGGARCENKAPEVDHAHRELSFRWNVASYLRVLSTML
jgi:hypothetical protein